MKIDEKEDNTLSKVDKIKLNILDKIKENHDFNPNIKEIKISGTEVFLLMKKNGIKWYQLEPILKDFKQKELINNYKSVNPYA